MTIFQQNTINKWEIKNLKKIISCKLLNGIQKPLYLIFNFNFIILEKR